MSTGWPHVTSLGGDLDVIYSNDVLANVDGLAGTHFGRMQSLDIVDNDALGESKRAGLALTSVGGDLNIDINAESGRMSTGWAALTSVGG